MIDNAHLLDRYREEKDRDMAELVRVGEALTDDLRFKIDEKTETTRRLEERLDESDRELRSCLLYTSPSPRDVEESRMPSSA